MNQNLLTQKSICDYIFLVVHTLKYILLRGLEFVQKTYSKKDRKRIGKIELVYLKLVNNSYGVIILLFGLLLSNSKGFAQCPNLDAPPIVLSQNLNGNRPNILLIIADDMGVDATPGYTTGSTKPIMPHLDSLATQGITFDNAWVNPVCAPTRATILTGKYGYRTGVLNAVDEGDIMPTERTIQSYLDQYTNTTYAHSIIGKWHLSDDANVVTQMGVDYFAGFMGGGEPDYYSWTLHENGGSATHNGYITEKLTDLATDWINNQNQPWFCWLAYSSPHDPYHVPPANTHNQGNLSTNQTDIDNNPRPYFMAMMENLDYEMGRLLDNIPAAALENTVILFIGDNGTDNQVLQSPYSTPLGKGRLYQGGIHVPLIVTGKDVLRKGEREDALIGGVDLFATIADIAGVSISNYQDSQTFKPLFTATDTESRTFNYTEVLRNTTATSGYTIRNNQYKLIQFDDGSKVLFDLLADPYETNDLLQGVLTTAQNMALNALETEVALIRT